MRAVASNSWGANKKVLLTIYRSSIRSVIDYGARAYNSASDNLKQRLDVIQQKALLIACGAFCSTAASALQVETGEVSLSLRRSQQELKYIVKVKATKGHPAKPVTEFHWTTFSKKFGKIIFLSYIFKNSGYFSEASSEPVDPPALPDEPPWHIKLCSADTSLINYGKKQDHPELLKTLALKNRLLQ